MYYVASLLIFSLTINISNKAFSQNTENGNSWKEVSSAGKGKLSILYLEQPGIITKREGKLGGVAPEILKDFIAYIKTKYNREVVLEYTGEEKEFPAFVQYLKNSPNTLGVSSVAITEERKQSIKFTPPFLSTPIVLVTPEGAPTVVDLDDLSQKLAGYVAESSKGTIYERELFRIRSEYLPTLEIKYVQPSDLGKSLLTNPKSFVIVDFLTYQGFRSKKISGKLQGITFGNVDLGFVMSKNCDWDKIWNEFLTDDYRQSTSYRKKVSEHLGASFLHMLR